MSFPQQSFNTLLELINYINTYIVPNGNEEISGTIHNNAENGLAKFIAQSPLNWSKAQILSMGGDVISTNPVVVITSVTPTSFGWESNIYNEVIIINTLNSSIPLLNGYSYKDIYLNTVTNIPAQTVVQLFQAENNLWIQGNNPSILGGDTFNRLQFNVGDINAPILDNESTLIISVNNPKQNSCNVYLDSMLLYEDLTDQISVDITYNTNNITILFNQAVVNGQKYLITYANN